MSKLSLIRFLRRVSSTISLFLLIVFSFPSSQNVQKKICRTEECLAATKNFKGSINFDADPCHDFYKYACGNWSQRSEHEPQSILESRTLENYLEITDFLKRNNSYDEPEAIHKARKLFSLCMSEAAYKNDLDQIETMLRKIGIPIDSLNGSEIVNFDYTASLARAARLTGASLYFHLQVLPNSYNRTTDTISLTVLKFNQEDKYESIKRMCENGTSTSCERLIFLLNFASNSTKEALNQQSEISKKARTLMDYSDMIDKESKSELNLHRPVKNTLEELQTWTDNIAAEVNATISTLNWTRYIEEFFIDTDNVTTNCSDPNKLQITIRELDSFKEMIQYIHKRQNTKIIAYELLREVIYTLQPYVDSTNKTEQECTGLTAELFPWAVGYMYTTKEKYNKAKTEIRKTFEHLRESFRQLLQRANWMDEITRQRAVKKLQGMQSCIAYPNIIANKSNLDGFYKDMRITDNFYDSASSLNEHRSTKPIKDPHEDDWIAFPNFVAALYGPDINTMYIPAGILGFPFYNDILHVLHYGAIGSVVGHEIGHAFDNIGRQYNEVGDIEDWWQPQTAKLFEEKARCFVQAKRNYYENGSKPADANFNEDTLGEDLADNVGFKGSLLAFRNYVSVYEKESSLLQFENFTNEQLFTLAYANMFCETPSHSNFVSIVQAGHSRAEFRVNGVFQNSNEFSEIWKCPKGSKMNPNDKCELW